MCTLAQLRDTIAGVLAANVKAYNLPKECVALGLAEGTGEDAFKSKNRYVQDRLAGKSKDVLLSLAVKVMEAYPTDGLQALLEKLAPKTHPSVSEVTRRNLVQDLSALGDLSGKLGTLEFLARMWNLDAAISDGFIDLRCLTVRDEIVQHMVRNDDWSYADALEYLGIAGISSKRFFEFLELLLHPLVRPGAEQEQYANTINTHLRRDGLNLCPVDQISGYPVYKVLPLRDGVAGTAKNLIFAADGPKPEIVIADAINNDIQIVKNAEYCLVYDSPIPATGLRWLDLVRWWAGKNGVDATSIETERELYRRLAKSLGSPPESLVFKSYFEKFKSLYGENLPALIPQVYLHYDPYTARELIQPRLPRQRMDFLILFSGYERVVIEVDGKQHYAVGDKADPKTYAEMVAADRDLRLAGYDVYRFGGHELAAESSVETIIKFFERLFAKYRVVPGGVTNLGTE